MALIKKDTLAERDPYTLIADDVPVPATGDVIVGLKRLLAGEGFSGHEGHVGVRIDPEDDLLEALPLLNKVALVAINFPKFGDGRGYSKARLLRERHGYKGELRAVGEVLTDQLFFMQRCGFDAYDLAPGKDVKAALAALHEFSVTYQGATDDALPIYRRIHR